MPRPKKGPRLWFRKERFGTKGKRIAAGSWVIIDGNSQVLTGYALEETGDAERALAEYNVSKFRPPRREQDIETTPIADVLAIYDADCREQQANKRTFDGRIKRLNDWWGAKMLAEVNGQSCRDYIDSRGSPGGARRDLEDLRAAINHHAKEGLHRGQVRITLPRKGKARDRWLTRSEVAKLLWACWRYREQQKRHRGADKGKTLPTKRATLQHVARFIIIALYTGTRAGAVANASPYRKEGRAWVDLDAGLFYRLAEGQQATNKRQPPAPLDTRLLSHLRRWKERKIATSHFVEYNQKPITSINKGFERAVELAKLEGDISPHTLRHTAATWLMQNGVEIWEAAGYLGMSEETLRTTYGHHHPDYLRGAAAGFRRQKAPPMVSPMELADKNAPKREQSETGIDKGSNKT